MTSKVMFSRQLSSAGNICHWFVCLLVIEIHFHLDGADKLPYQVPLLA